MRYGKISKHFDLNNMVKLTISLQYKIWNENKLSAQSFYKQNMVEDEENRHKFESDVGDTFDFFFLLIIKYIFILDVQFLEQDFNKTNTKFTHSNRGAQIDYH